MAFEDLPKPADYVIHGPDPVAAADRDIQMVAGLAQAQQARQLHAAQLQEAQLKIAAGQRTVAFNRTVANSPQTPEGLVAAMYQFPDKIKEIKDIQDQAGEMENKRLLSLWGPTAAASMNGTPEEVREQAGKILEAATNSNRPQDAQKAQAFLKAYNDPTTRGGAIRQLNGTVALAMGPDKYLEHLGAANKLPAALRQAEDEALKAHSDVGISQNTLDYAKKTSEQELATKRAAQLSSEASTAESNQKREQERTKFLIGLPAMRREAGALPAADLKKYNEDDEAFKSNVALANKIGGVAQGYDKEKPTPGLLGQIQTQYRTVMGNRTKADQVKTQYSQILNAATLEQLKGAGRMTQGEINLVQGGFPSVNASTGEITGFLRTLKKATLAKADLAREGMQWTAAHQTSGPAPEEGTRVYGLTFRKGALPPSISAPGIPPEKILKAVQYVQHGGGNPADVAALKKQLDDIGVKY